MVEQAEILTLANGQRSLVDVAHIQVAGGIRAFRQNLNGRTADHDEFHAAFRPKRAAQRGHLQTFDASGLARR